MTYTYQGIAVVWLWGASRPRNQKCGRHGRRQSESLASLTVEVGGPFREAGVRLGFL